MEQSNIIKIALVSMVAIVVVVGFTIPLINGMTQDVTVEGINDPGTSEPANMHGRYRYAESFTATTVGGKAIDGESLAEIFDAGGGRYLITNLGVFSTAGSGYTYYAATIVSNVTEITLDSGTMTYTAGGTTATVEGVKFAYLPAIDGPYIQTPFKAGYYVNADDQLIYFNANSTKTGVSYGTATDRHVDAYWINGTSDPSQMTGTFVPIQKGNTTVYGIASVSPTNLVIPEIYTYTETEGVGGPVGSMIGLIPLLLVVSLVMGIIGIVTIRRGE